jgi:threonine synthase
MKYQSTRGHQKILSFEQAVLQGLGPDGGLYIPTEIPHFSEQVISTWKDLSFAQVAFNVCRNFISSTEIADETLKELCTKSFSTFSHPKVTPVNKLPVGMEIAPNKNFDNLWILELFHGPTFAFKDVALQFLGNLFEYFLEKKNSEKSPQDKEAFITVIGATSGDTGGAAIYGLQGKKNIDIFILHPHKRISRVQEQQMTTVLTSNGIIKLIKFIISLWKGVLMIVKI